MIQVHHFIMYLPPIILNVTKWLFNLVVTWIFFSFCTEARSSLCLGGKFYFKPFIYVSIKIVYFYGIHKVVCLFFASKIAILSLFILKELSKLFYYYSFWCRDDFMTFCFWNRISSSNMYIIWDMVQTLPFSKVSVCMINGGTDCIFLVICDNWYNTYAHISFKMNYVK